MQLKEQHNHLILQLFNDVARRGGYFVAVQMMQATEGRRRAAGKVQPVGRDRERIMRNVGQRCVQVTGRGVMV